MEMHLRKLRMLQTCKKYGDVLKAPEMLSKKNTLIWDLTDNLIYCRIAKVKPRSMVVISMKLRVWCQSQYLHAVKILRHCLVADT